VLVDCFLGFDEVKLGEFRMLYLSKYVDRTLIVESKKTFSGDDKPLYFSEWRESLSVTQKSRIEIIELDDSFLTSNNAWDRDIFSRESLHRIAIANFPKARFIFSDLDEIPSLKQVEAFIMAEGNYHFRCRTVYRKANLFVQGRHDNWNYGVFSSSPVLLAQNGGRFQKLPMITSSETGIHFSYLGMSPKRIEAKLNSFAHTEYRGLNIDFTNYLSFCDKYSIDHLGRIRSETFGLLKFVPLESLRSPLLKSLADFNLNWFHRETSRQNILKRIIASGVASFGMRVSRSNEIHPFRRLLFSKFFSRNPHPTFGLVRESIRLIMVTGAIFEIVFAILWNIRRIAKKLLLDARK
jgi:hypothetical protein